MNNKLVFGSLALALLVGFVGVLLSVEHSRREYPESSFDDVSGEPLGI